MAVVETAIAWRNMTAVWGQNVVVAEPFAATQVAMKPQEDGTLRRKRRRREGENWFCSELYWCHDPQSRDADEARDRPGTLEHSRSGTMQSAAIKDCPHSPIPQEKLYQCQHKRCERHMRPVHRG